MNILSCHCGAVELQIKLSDGFNTARRCDCSFCQKRGAPAVSVLLADLTVTRGQDNLSKYTWGSHTAQHFFCKTCGIYTHHQRRSNPNEYGVNLGAIAGVHLASFGDIPWLDGRNHPKDRS